MLTKEQKEAYLADSNVCPFCKGNNFDAGHLYIEGSYAYMKITCNDCEKVWTDEYRLVNVFTPDEPDSLDEGGKNGKD